MNTCISTIIALFCFYNSMLSSDTTDVKSKSANRFSVVLDFLHTSPVLRNEFPYELQNWKNTDHLPILVCDSLIPASGAAFFITTKEYISMKFTPEEIRRTGYDSLRRISFREMYKLSRDSHRMFSKDLATLKDSPEPELVVFMYPLDSNIVVATVFPYWDNYKEEFFMYSYFFTEVKFLVKFDHDNKIVKFLYQKMHK